MVSIRILAGIAEQDLARGIFDQVWPSSDGTQITANLLQAMVHNGTYVAGAFINGEIVAAAFAFPGLGEDKHLHLHSHMAAVKEEFRNQDIGSALKKHQKLWALENGYDEIRWTFDPLVRRNARLNLGKLGVRVYNYFPDFYGELDDALNAGDPTDRVIAHWELTKDWQPEFNGEGIETALAFVDGKPISRQCDAEKVLCYLPEDIVQLRAQDSELALQWRLALRHELQSRLDAGWQITGFTHDGAYIVSKRVV